MVFVSITIKHYIMFGNYLKIDITLDCSNL